MHDRNNDNPPEIPDDISESIGDIKDSEDQRQKAIDIMTAKALASISDDEREMWLEKVREFQAIHDKYVESHPEISPDDNPEV